MPAVVGNVGMLKWFAAGRCFPGGRNEHEEPGGASGTRGPLTGMDSAPFPARPHCHSSGFPGSPGAAAGKRGASGGGHGEETPKQAAGRYF